MSTLVFSFGLSSAFCLLLAVGLLTSRALNPLCARLLGLNYLLIALQGALGLAVFTGVWPQAALIRVVIAMLLGPALYAYFISALRPAKLNSWRWHWHLLPVLAMGLVLWQQQWSLIDGLIIASFFGYWLTVLWQMRRTKREHSEPSIPSPANTWLWILVALMPVNILLEIAIAFEIRAGARLTETYALALTGVIFALFNGITLLLALARAPIIEWMHELKRPEPSALSDADKRQVFERWQQLVEVKALYRTEASMTVTRAARLLGVPARQLSQAINGIYGGSFSQYLNDVRVTKAKALLLSHPNMSVTEVYMQAGFSTKSQFHREFSRVAGATPSAFRDTAARA